MEEVETVGALVGLAITVAGMAVIVATGVVFVRTIEHSVAKKSPKSRVDLSGADGRFDHASQSHKGQTTFPADEVRA